MTEIANPEELSAEARQSLANWLMAMSDTKHLLGLRDRKSTRLNSSH